MCCAYSVSFGIERDDDDRDERDGENETTK
jgi:hypothetical protein